MQPSAPAAASGRPAAPCPHLRHGTVLPVRAARPALGPRHHVVAARFHLRSQAGESSEVGQSGKHLPGCGTGCVSQSVGHAAPAALLPCTHQPLDLLLPQLLGGVVVVRLQRRGQAQHPSACRRQHGLRRLQQAGPRQNVHQHASKHRLQHEQHHSQNRAPCARPASSQPAPAPPRLPRRPPPQPAGPPPPRPPARWLHHSSRLRPPRRHHHSRLQTQQQEEEHNW